MKTELHREVEAFRKKRVGIINQNPILVSLLYDLDLLPEQVKENTREEWQLNVIVMHWEEALAAGNRAT